MSAISRFPTAAMRRTLAKAFASRVNIFGRKDARSADI